MSNNHFSLDFTFDDIDEILDSMDDGKSIDEAIGQIERLVPDVVSPDKSPMPMVSDRLDTKPDVVTSVGPCSKANNDTTESSSQRECSASSTVEPVDLHAELACLQEKLAKIKADMVFPPLDYLRVISKEGDEGYISESSPTDESVYITVTFSEGQKRYVFPSAFIKGYLITHQPSVQSWIRNYVTASYDAKEIPSLERRINRLKKELGES